MLLLLIAWKFFRCDVRIIFITPKDELFNRKEMDLEENVSHFSFATFPVDSIDRGEEEKKIKDIFSPFRCTRRSSGTETKIITCLMFLLLKTSI
jgi:hypothetical protein